MWLLTPNGAMVFALETSIVDVLQFSRLSLLALSPKPRRLHASAYDMYASTQGKNADGALPHACKCILTSLCTHVKDLHAGRTRSRGPFFIAHCPGIWVRSQATVE